MKPTNTEHKARDTKSAKSRSSQDDNLSKDGKWRSFPKVPNLLQYVSSGAYYGRIKIQGKLYRESLNTTVWTDAKLFLSDFLKKKRKEAARPMTGTVGEAREQFERETKSDHTLKEGSKRYRTFCIKAIQRTWPELDELPPTKVTERACRDWAARFSDEFDAQFFNNSLGILRRILERAGITREDNPAYKVKRLGVKPKEMKLPEPSEFEKLIKTMETAGSRWSPLCADFARFLAYSGCRLSEARQVRWRDVDFERCQIRVQNAKRARTSNAADYRFVPMIEEMKRLLTRLKAENPSADDPVCKVGECEKSLTRACKRLEIPRITHHDLRHLFATRCAESGVDIPTLSRWLGHSDGGALAMKVYGHLRREHSLAMAQKVTFGREATASNDSQNNPK